MRRTIARAAAFTLCALLAAAWPAAAAPAPCSVAISLTPSSQVAEITATQPGAVTFHGAVVVDAVAGARTIVTLEPAVSTGWTASAAPSSMVFASGGSTQDFDVSVVVPAAEPASSIGQLTVTARGTSAGLQCPPALASAIVSPSMYFGPWNASLAPPSAEPRPGATSVVYLLNVSYVSNAEAPGSVPLDFQVPEGAVHDAPPQLGLSAKGGGTYSASIEIHVRISNVANGTYQIRALLGATQSKPEGVVAAVSALTIAPRSVAGDPAPTAIAIVVAALVISFISRRRALSNGEAPVERLAQPPKE